MSYDNYFNSELAVPPVPGSERNQRLVWQDWKTNDVNVRLTWRPKIPAKPRNVGLVTRYDYFSTLISGQWAISPTQMGTFRIHLRPRLILSRLRAHGFDYKSYDHRKCHLEPVRALYLQATVSYVLNQTNTPVTGVDP